MPDLQTHAAVSRLLTERGWVASWGELRSVADRATLERLVADGHLHRIARGRYAAPVEIPARLAAERVAGVASYRTAAQHYGLAMKWLPSRPSITVPRGRSVGARGEGLHLSHRSLPSADIDGWVTTPLRTVADCAATLPFDEALTIADSALRSRLIIPAQLAARAMDWPARGRQRVSRVARHADGRSSGPIESVLRAICLQIPGLSVTPQARIERDGRFLATVDLADERLRIVIEAEGFEFHGDREGFDRDCHRYDELVADGWVVLRFTWEHVMRRDRWVARILAATVAHRMTLVELRSAA